jgi:hypothetical protein
LVDYNADFGDALLATKVPSEVLPLISFGEWFEALEEQAKTGDAHDLNSIVSMYLQSTDSQFLIVSDS